MAFETILTTILTHPLHALLIGMILSRLTGDAARAITQTRGTHSGSSPAPAAGLSETSA
jgi:hypothetical protein